MAEGGSVIALGVRPFARNDEAEVIALWEACGLVVPQNDPKRDIERKLRVNPDWFLVGEVEGRIVASCMVGYEGHRGAAPFRVRDKRRKSDPRKPGLDSSLFPFPLAHGL
jgi:hypothetical protein